MLDSPSPAALARYLSGESDAAEVTEIGHWIESDPEYRAQVDAMRAMWTRPAVADFDPDDTIWQRITSLMETEFVRPRLVEQPSPQSVPQSVRSKPEHFVRVGHASRRSLAWRTPMIAAYLVIALVGGAVMWRAPWRGRLAPTTVAMREIVTQRGQQAVLDLADGSRVRLGPESSIRLPTNFGDNAGSRDLTLEGAAFFSVTHDRAHPFRVRTRSGVAEDLGTEFVVTDYPETHGMRVIVASGAVAIRRPIAPDNAPPLATLTKGMLARLDKAGTAVVRQDVDVAAYLAWTHGELAFDGMPLREAVPELSRWYDLDITLADTTIGERRVTASFADESATSALRRLALALNLRIQRHGRVVKLRPL